jgi:hypothetical protein
MQDLIADQIDLLFQGLYSLPLARLGSIKAYAVTGDTRSVLAPEIPTMAEMGLPTVSYSSWLGFFAPKDTPRDIILKLNAATVQALADPAVRSRLTDLGVEIFPRERQTPEALAALVVGVACSADVRQVRGVPRLQHAHMASGLKRSGRPRLPSATADLLPTCRAAYCERFGISFAEYRKRFEVTPGRLLDDTRHVPPAHNDGMTVAKSFALAIEEVAKLNPAAEPLIVHAALLAPEPIPLFLFAEAREKFGAPRRHLPTTA